MTQSEALNILKTGANVFLTGEPGAGKTYTINEYVSYLRSLGVEPAITASTGIAATHIGGMTIHSWSGIGIKSRLTEYDLDKIASSEYIVKRVRRAKVLVMDEISMLSGETLNMVDAVCKEIKRNSLSFGGIQVVLVGDFFQLPPINKTNREEDYAQISLLGEIKSHFAYESPSWKYANFIACYLTEQHRQDDADFLSVLSSIRQRTFGVHHIQHIEKRKILIQNAPAQAPKLFSHNVDVDSVNEEALLKISGDLKFFEMTSRGNEVLVSALKKGCLSPEKLSLKIGASIMFTKNNPREGFVNGTLGEVIGFDKENGYPLIKTRRERTILVEPMDWAVEEAGTIRARITQIPLRLAWAITVHKSQGMSLDEAVVDLSQVFEYGQGYVALSRVRRFAGLYLLGWNRMAFQVHPEVFSKDSYFREASEEAREAFFHMGRDEITKLHTNFVTACGGKKSRVKLRTKTQTRSENRFGVEDKKKTTFEITLEIFKKGNNIAEIAKERGLAETTIVSHVEKLFMKDLVSKKEILRIIPAKTRVDLERIEKAFHENGEGKLLPVFEKFKGKYPYEDLRLVRLVL